MTVQVFDKSGVQRDWNWLRATYGNVTFLDAGPGPKFRLMRVDETSGPATLKVRVLNGDGAPQAQQPVANHWPDDELPLLTGKGLKTVWRDRAIYQYTDISGWTGFGLGTGSYIRDLNAGGPHVVWVLSPSLPSDGLAGIGMLGGTEHAGPLFLTFQVSSVGTPQPEPEPEPEPAPATDLAPVLAELQRIATAIEALAGHFGVADYGRGVETGASRLLAGGAPVTAAARKHGS